MHITKCMVINKYMNNIIKIKNLSKNYKIDKTEYTVLHSINLDVNQGEMVAIMGTSGSGKSITIR